jgi:hypothetical protein
MLESCCRAGQLPNIDGVLRPKAQSGSGADHPPAVRIMERGRPAALACA